MVYAVIDTNIFVSAFITKNATASTRRVINSLFAGKIKPLYNDEIQTNGIDSSRFPYDGDMLDEDDRVFYEVALSEEDSFLVTGNLKHFPKTPKVVTAAQMMEILDHEE